jgi:hypothetical protein
MVRRHGLYDIHSLDPTGCEVSVHANMDFCNKVMNSSALREKLVIAEQITGKQTAVTAMLFGRNDGAKDTATQNELKMQEKIMREKKRMVESD